LKTVALLYDHKLDVGGVESHLLGLLRNMAGDPFRFVLISQVSDPFAAKMSALGAKVIRFGRWNGLNPLAVRALAAILRKEKIDLVHAHSPLAALSGRLAARWLGIPAVVTVHLPVTQDHGILQTRRARLGRWLYTGLDRILNHCCTARLIYVSQKVRDSCVGQGLSPASNSRVIPVGIPLAQFTPCPDRAALRMRLGAPTEPAGPVITFVGRFNEQKGLDVLFEAAKQLAAQQVDFQLWLVGDGPLRPGLESQAREPGLETRVRFWGWQEAVAPYLQASDIFVLPSRYEGMPISLLEALACGLPAVVTRVGENEETVQDGENGLEVTPGNAGELADALARLVASPELREQMGRKAPASVARFDEAETARKVEQVYRGVRHT
jgi:glycosyltransferase involved in cell wall biosynthesis